MAEGLLQGLPGLYSKFQDNQNYRVRPVLKELGGRERGKEEGRKIKEKKVKKKRERIHTGKQWVLVATCKKLTVLT